MDAHLAAADFHTHQPDVLLLAFKQLRLCEDFYLALYRVADGLPLHRHRALILCTREEVRQAYELCRRGLFDDYVLFWPFTHDVTRLQMSVHQAVEALAASPGHDALGTATATQARRRIIASDLEASQGPVVLPASTRQSVWVIDDDEFQRKLTAQILEAEDYRVRGVASGAEAIGLLSHGSPDLMLLDYLMPEMNGMEVLRRLKADSRLGSIPVIMITGNSERGVVLDSQRLGAADFLVKPFDRQTLLDKIARVLHLNGSAKRAAAPS
ncbi:MAG: response regulator [Gammaproteobacteria bacterium]|nr:response regulator [Gammaproteobacteria bacterium]